MAKLSSLAQRSVSNYGNRLPGWTVCKFRFRNSENCSTTFLVNESRTGNPFVRCAAHPRRKSHLTQTNYLAEHERSALISRILTAYLCLSSYVGKQVTRDWHVWHGCHYFFELCWPLLFARTRQSATARPALLCRRPIFLLQGNVEHPQLVQVLLE